MTRVLEVAAAEDVTGHPYSLAVTSPEGVTFVKGTCREETRWWTDVLQVYSRNKVSRAGILPDRHAHRPLLLRLSATRKWGKKWIV